MDKTATFVARNGPDFEKKILQNEASNTKFAFLQADNQFNAYYKMKLEEMSDKAHKSISAVGGVRDAVATPEAFQGKATAIAAETMAKRAELKAAAQPKEPPPPDHFLVEHPKMVTSTSPELPISL